MDSSSPFGLYNTAARFQTVVEAVARKVIQQIYPIPRYAVVDSINFVTRRVTVHYPDEVGTTFEIPVATVMPVTAGQTVRVAGPAGARYVDEVVNGQVKLETVVVGGASTINGVTTISVDDTQQLILDNPTNANEGGQLQLNGAGAYADWQIDTFQGIFRTISGGNVKQQIGSNYVNFPYTGAIDGGWVLRPWTGDPGYNSLATNSMTGSEYVILSTGVETYISGGAGATVTIRAGANDASQQIAVSPAGMAFTSEAVPTGHDDDGTNMGLMPAFYTNYVVLGGGQVSMTGSIYPLINTYVDTRRGGIVLIAATIDVACFGTGGAFVGQLNFNGGIYSEQMIYVGSGAGDRCTVSKTWILNAPQSSSWFIGLEAYETGGDYRVNPLHTNFWYLLMR